MRVWPGDARVPGSVAPGVGRDPAVEAERQSPRGGEQLTGLQRQRNPPAALSRNTRREAAPRRSPAPEAEAKATESTPDLERVPKNSPGVMGVELVRRLSWELERPSSAPGLRPGKHAFL